MFLSTIKPQINDQPNIPSTAQQSIATEENESKAETKQYRTFNSIFNSVYFESNNNTIFNTTTQGNC
jgi:5-methylcytosine-specific restriction endonuclease McrBC GTP-binding regulatory subunit McrB